MAASERDYIRTYGRFRAFSRAHSVTAQRDPTPRRYYVNFTVLFLCSYSSRLIILATRRLPVFDSLIITVVILIGSFVSRFRGSRIRNTMGT